MKKADKFDASKWLIENKITRQSRLNENQETDTLTSLGFKEEFGTGNYSYQFSIPFSDRRLYYISYQPEKGLDKRYIIDDYGQKLKTFNSLEEMISHLKQNMKYHLNSSLNEEEDSEDYEDYEDFDLDAAFKSAPNKAPYNDVLEIIKSYEYEDLLKSFMNSFPKGKPVSKDEYFDWNYKNIDDMSEVSYIQANWISMFDDDIFEKAGLAF